MPTDSIPFANLQESGYEELAGASPIAMNVVVDGKGSVMRRPGIQAYSGAPSTVIDAHGISGVYITVKGDLFAVGGSGAERPIYHVTASGATALGGGISPSGLRGTLRPTFAETELLLVIAGGDAVEKVVLPTAHFSLSSSRLNGTPTPTASHIIANNLRLLANDVVTDRTKVRFSDVAGGDTDFSGNEVWSLGGVGTSGFFTAEANPDPVVGLFNVQNEVMVFGSTTTQVFLPDPQLVYAPSAIIEDGMGAPYSFIRSDRQVYWVDQRRRVVLSDRRGFDTISDGIQRTLESMSTVSDCFGYRITSGFLDVPVFSFPTDGRTFVYQDKVGWGQWSGWNDSTNNWSPFLVTCSADPPDESIHVVGTSDGRIGELSLDANTDFGTRINAYVVTGYIDRGTNNLKHCQCVRFALRRGTTSSTPGPQALIYFRDRPGAWSDPIPLDIGSSGDTEVTLSFYSLGVYRRRQWKFVFSDTSVALALVSATEDYTVQDN